jgi:hypothetical protein
MENSQKRYVIYAYDLTRMLDVNLRTAQRYITQAKIALEKEAHQLITVKEYCQYMDWPIEEVYAYIPANS